jgi:hypothetical protein
MIYPTPEVLAPLPLLAKLLITQRVISGGLTHVVLGLAAARHAICGRLVDAWKYGSRFGFQ